VNNRATEVQHRMLVICRLYS